MLGSPPPSLPVGGALGLPSVSGAGPAAPAVQASQAGRRTTVMGYQPARSAYRQRRRTHGHIDGSLDAARERAHRQMRTYL